MINLDGIVFERIDPIEFENLKIELLNSKYTVTLFDGPDIEILRGYGDTIVAAINDLHNNLK